jgi:hypothetical protein
MEFEERFFARFNFSTGQVRIYLANARRDLEIAKQTDILDVKFNYAYSALIKGGNRLAQPFSAQGQEHPRPPGENHRKYGSNPKG